MLYVILYFSDYRLPLLYHYKICKKNSHTFYLLFFYHFITSFFKKRSCRNRRMSNNTPMNFFLQNITNISSNPFSLIIGMNI